MYLMAKGKPFEIVFVSADKGREGFEVRGKVLVPRGLGRTYPTCCVVHLSTGDEWF